MRKQAKVNFPPNKTESLTWQYEKLIIVSRTNNQFIKGIISIDNNMRKEITPNGLYRNHTHTHTCLLRTGIDSTSGTSAVRVRFYIIISVPTLRTRYGTQSTSDVFFAVFSFNLFNSVENEN